MAASAENKYRMRRVFIEPNLAASTALRVALAHGVAWNCKFIRRPDMCAPLKRLFIQIRMRRECRARGSRDRRRARCWNIARGANVTFR